MIYLILIFTLLPSLAWAAASINVPTIMLTERLMAITFVLIVSLEAWIFIKYLPKLTKKQSLITSIKANLLTILFVVPLVWGLWLYIALNMPDFTKNLPFSDTLFLVVGSVWVDITQSLLLAEWFMVPVYFIASFYFEYWFCRNKLKDFPKEQVKKAFFFANLYSYLMIMTLETIYQLAITPYKANNPYLW